MALAQIVLTFIVMAVYTRAQARASLSLNLRPASANEVPPTTTAQRILVGVTSVGLLLFLVAPLVAPLGKAYGIDPIHLGVVFLANLELGFLFPPMGLNLFLSAQRFGKPLPFVYRKAFPFLVIMSVGVLLVTYLEPMTTGVVRLFKG